MYSCSVCCVIVVFTCFDQWVQLVNMIVGKPPCIPFALTILLLLELSCSQRIRSTYDDLTGLGDGDKVEVELGRSALLEGPGTIRCNTCRIKHGRDVCRLYGFWMWTTDCKWKGHDRYEEFFEGDMKESEDCIEPGNCVARGWSISMTDGRWSKRWPDGIIPYTFARDFESRSRPLVMRAIRAFQANTCVRFVPRTDEEYYVKFVSERACWSHVGRQNSYAMPQKISLPPHCMSTGVAIHEMMHTLGFYHEHSRPDRDSYIKINYKNVPYRLQYNFRKYEVTSQKNINFGYDYDSIMHYPADAFARVPWLKTIVPITNGRDDPSIKIGQRHQLSPIDIKEINALYECDKPRPQSRTRTRRPTTRPRPRPTSRRTRRPNTRRTTRSRTSATLRAPQQLRTTTYFPTVTTRTTTTTTPPTTQTPWYYRTTRTRSLPRTTATTTRKTTLRTPGPFGPPRCQDNNSFCGWVPMNFCDNFGCLRAECKKQCNACGDINV